MTLKKWLELDLKKEATLAFEVSTKPNNGRFKKLWL